MKSKMKEIRRSKSSRSTEKGKSSVSSKIGRSPPLCKGGRSPGSIDLMKLPSVPAGEDKVSFQRHNCVLKAEFSKVRHNKQIVSELMNVTFPMHSADILQSPCNINKILEKYPFLRKDFVSTSSLFKLFNHVKHFSIYSLSPTLVSYICSHVSFGDEFDRKVSMCILVIFQSAEIEAKTSASFSSVCSEIIQHKPLKDNSISLKV